MIAKLTGMKVSARVAEATIAIEDIVLPADWSGVISVIQGLAF